MRNELTNRTYKVGGAVRDKFLGRVPKDIDYVIELTSEVEFRKHFPCEIEVPRVGENFPVYLVKGDEVALARTEKSTGNGYSEFTVEVNVSITEDLARRDFTINSIAEHFVTGEIVDPFNGVEDIAKKLLRCVNKDAFNEDPLRIYRGARAISRFGLTVAPATLELIRTGVKNLHLVNPERVFAELKKVYAESEYPSDFFRALLHFGALEVHFAPLAALNLVPAGPWKHHGRNTAFDHTMEAIDRCKEKGYSFEVFVAVLAHDFGKGTTKREILPSHYGHELRSREIAIKWLAEHKFTAAINKLVPVACAEHMLAHNLNILKPVTLIRWYRRIKTYIPEIVQVFDCDHELTAAQVAILAELRVVFTTTEINIPPATLKKGKEAINAFVEGAYAKTLKENRRG